MIQFLEYSITAFLCVAERASDEAHLIQSLDNFYWVVSLFIIFERYKTEDSCRAINQNGLSLFVDRIVEAICKDVD